MSHPISEALLEMRYFDVLVNHFKELLGTERLRILKPTPQREKWLGYDQGYVQADEEEGIIEDSLRALIHDEMGLPFVMFKAFFLQFKVVERRVSRRNIPPGFDKPWLASSISTDPDKNSKMSQHETLVRLAGLPDTEVSYACPMIFDRRDLACSPSLQTLRMVNVLSAPAGWLTSAKHKIAFQTPNSKPFWCSDPMEAKEWTFEEAFRRLPELNMVSLRLYLRSVETLIRSISDVANPSQPLPDSLFVVAYGPK